YEAVQLGYGKANPKRLPKPLAGYFKQAGIEPVRFLREVRTDSAGELEVGQKLGADLFQPGDRVHVVGNTKGRGFAGGMKRWGWHGGKATHGSTSHRRIGSVGAGTSPGRVLRGRNLPGQYGNERVMVRNLRVVKVEPDKGLLYIKGAVPGNRGSLLLVKKV
ncbi:MAG: 50S ribosomal protein L3, partial [candidate division WOR-3 bacterium]